MWYITENYPAMCLQQKAKQNIHCCIYLQCSNQTKCQSTDSIHSGTQISQLLKEVFSPVLWFGFSSSKKWTKSCSPKIWGLKKNLKRSHFLQYLSPYATRGQSRMFLFFWENPATIRRPYLQRKFFADNTLPSIWQQMNTHGSPKPKCKCTVKLLLIDHAGLRSAGGGLFYLIVFLSIMMGMKTGSLNWIIEFSLTSLNCLS